MTKSSFFIIILTHFADLTNIFISVYEKLNKKETKMKKKILLAFMLCFVGLSLCGCGANTLDMVKDNMSELTNVYYFGENADCYCSLSSGKREKEYLLNGQSGECVPFALLSLHPTENIAGKVVLVKVTIDGVESEKELEINSLNSAYMVDLEKEFSGEEKIAITFNGKVLTLECLSKNFAIDSQKALEIASKELADKITMKKSFSKLNAECYLRVLDKKANKQDGVFWCFSVLNVDNENYSVIISTTDGKVLAKSK